MLAFLADLSRLLHSGRPQLITLRQISRFYDSTLDSSLRDAWLGAAVIWAVGTGCG